MDEDRSQATEDLITSLETSASDAIEKVKEVVNKVWEAIKKLIEKVVEMVSNIRKNFDKQKERIDGLKEEDLKDGVWEQTVQAVAVNNSTKVGDDEEPDEGEFKIPNYLPTTGKNYEAFREALKSIRSQKVGDAAKQLKKISQLPMPTITKREEKKLSDIGIHNLQTMQETMEATEAILDELQQLKDVKSTVQSDVVKVILQANKIDDADPAALADGLKDMQRAVNRQVKSGTKIIKMILSAAKQVE